MKQDKFSRTIPLPIPSGTPISNFIQIEAEETSEPIRHVLMVLDDIHGVDATDFKIPFLLVDKLASGYDAAYDPIARTISMRSSYTLKEIGAVEEIFHAIHFNLMSRSALKPEQETALLAWYQLLMSTDTIHELFTRRAGETINFRYRDRIVETVIIEEDKLEWAKRGEEILARSYVQYVETVTLDQRVRELIWKLRHTGWAISYSLYWGEKEFDNIRNVLEAFFRSKEWIK